MAILVVTGKLTYKCKNNENQYLEHPLFICDVDSMVKNEHALYSLTANSDSICYVI